MVHVPRVLTDLMWLGMGFRKSRVCRPVGYIYWDPIQLMIYLSKHKVCVCVSCTAGEDDATSKQSPLSADVYTLGELEAILHILLVLFGSAGSTFLPSLLTLQRKLRIRVTGLFFPSLFLCCYCATNDTTCCFSLLSLHCYNYRNYPMIYIIVYLKWAVIQAVLLQSAFTHDVWKATLYLHTLLHFPFLNVQRTSTHCTENKITF